MTNYNICIGIILDAILSMITKIINRANSLMKKCPHPIARTCVHSSILFGWHRWTVCLHLIISAIFLKRIPAFPLSSSLKLLLRVLCSMKHMIPIFVMNLNVLCQEAGVICPYFYSVEGMSQAHHVCPHDSFNGKWDGQKFPEIKTMYSRMKCKICLFDMKTLCFINWTKSVCTQCYEKHSYPMAMTVDADSVCDWNHFLGYFCRIPDELQWPIFLLVVSHKIEKFSSPLI